MPPPLQKQPRKPGAKPKIFIVHGRKARLREMVARFLTEVGCQPQILHELPNKGRSIFQKFDESSDVEFAVVLLTGDDVGGRKAGSLKKRARQNVILELGYFLGKLGQGRVCPLYENGVELPSDYGPAYIKLDQSWKTALARELKAAGLRIRPHIL